jgi:hypothetical protein
MASDTSTINFLLLVELIVVVIAASAFLFYWNRLLGSLVALLIRAFAWRSHSAYVTIGSLQISPLAGRISFRDIEYHSSNLSVRALHGHITFRYWIFRVRQEADTLSDKVKRSESLLPYLESEMFTLLGRAISTGTTADNRSTALPDLCVFGRSGMFCLQPNASLRGDCRANEKA